MESFLSELARKLASNSRKIFEIAVQLVFGVILIFLGLGIVVGALQLFVQLASLVRFEGITGHYIDIITDVLTLYVLVELSRSLVEYFYSKRLKLALVVDAAMIFILREVLIGVFKNDLEVDMLYALSTLILALGIVRTASVVFFDKEHYVTRKSN